jgi:hypothetical protein
VAELALFEVPDDAYIVPPPPEPPEELTRGERRKRLVATRITSGVHPLGRPVLLHPQASRTITEAGHETTLPTCGTCHYRVLLRHHDRTYPKCWYPDLDAYPHPRDTGCESSDIRAWWPACIQYERETKQEDQND